jgi:class 3 adenylate cyclase
MVEAHTNRRLAAIRAADVVGYSRMMATDEAGTHAALRRHREAVPDPTVAANHGRIVRLIGDGTVVEFASVVDAVGFQLQTETKATARLPMRSATPGAGRSMHGAWPKLRVGFSYAMNLMRDGDIRDTRSGALIDALHVAVGK